MNRLLQIIVLLIVSLSFQNKPPVTRAQLIDAAVSDRLEKSRRGFAGRCDRDALEQAVIYADSIIVERAFLERDTSGRPPRPARPTRPEPLRPRDSFAVEPILKDSL